MSRFLRLQFESQMGLIEKQRRKGWKSHVKRNITAFFYQLIHVSIYRYEWSTPNMTCDKLVIQLLLARFRWVSFTIG